MSAAPITTDTARRWAKVRRSRAWATGTVRSAAHRARSIATSTGRLDRNSTQGPSGTATTAPAVSPAAESSAARAGPASSTGIAMSAKESNANRVPNVLTAYAVQSQWRPSWAR